MDWPKMRHFALWGSMRHLGNVANREDATYVAFFYGNGDLEELGMSSNGKGVCKETQNDMIPTSSLEPMRTDTIFLADELPGASDAIKWARAPKMPGLGEISSGLLLHGGFDGYLGAQKSSVV